VSLLDRHRQQVEHRHPLGDPQRMVEPEWHEDTAVTDPDPRGAGGDERQEDLGRAHVRVPGERVVLDCPDRVETHLLGVHGLVDTVHQRLTLELR
jgi:hypothetical protein